MNENFDTNSNYTPYEPLIVIDKPEALHDDEFCVSTGNILEAQNTLSPVAFFLYMYLALFDDKESFRFFGLRFCDRFGFTRDMYLDAYNELVDANYLTTSTQNSPVLFFHGYPLVPPYLFDEYEEGENNIPDAM